MKAKPAAALKPSILAALAALLAGCAASGSHPPGGTKPAYLDAATEAVPDGAELGRRSRGEVGLRTEVVGWVAEGIEAVGAGAGRWDLSLVTGCLYTVADARRALREEP